MARTAQCRTVLRLITSRGPGAAQAMNIPDYQELGTREEPLEVTLYEDRFLLTWRADHAVKQVRIVRLEVV